MGNKAPVGDKADLTEEILELVSRVDGLEEKNVALAQQMTVNINDPMDKNNRIAYLEDRVAVLEKNLAALEKRCKDFRV